MVYLKNESLCLTIPMVLLSIHIFNILNISIYHIQQIFEYIKMVDILSFISTILSILTVVLLVYNYLLKINKYRKIIMYEYYQVGSGELVCIHPINEETKISCQKFFDEKLKDINSDFTFILNRTEKDNLFYSTRDKNYFERNYKNYILTELNKRVKILEKIKESSDNYIKLKYATKLSDVLWCCSDFYEPEEIIESHINTINRIKEIKLISKKEYYEKYINKSKEMYENYKINFITHKGVFVDIEPEKLFL